MVKTMDSIPFMGGNQRVRDQVLLILSTDYPLSVKQIYSRISRNGIDISYQAVHKVIKQLIESRILVKGDKGVQLSKNWINQVKDYAISVDTIYTKGKSYILPEEIDKPITMHFPEMSMFIVWLAETFRDMKLTKGKRVSCYGLFNHLLWPLRFNFMDFELLRQMVAANPESMCASAKNTPFDQWIGRHYQLGGMKRVRIGVPELEIDGAILAHGDCVFQINFSPDTQKFMDRIYTKINTLGDLFQFYFTDIVNQDTSVTVTIERNPTIAKILKSQLLKYLEEESTKKMT